MTYFLGIIFIIASLSLFIWVFVRSIQEGIEEARIRRMMREAKERNEQFFSKPTPKAKSTFVERSTICFDTSSILEAEAKEQQKKEQSPSKVTPPSDQNARTDDLHPVVHSTDQSATPSATFPNHATTSEQTASSRQAPPQKSVSSSPKTSSPTNPTQRNTTTTVIEVPKLKIAPGYFTPEQMEQYKKRGSSMRLGRALTQGMLLEHLKTDKTTTPYTASATVHSLHSGFTYQTTLTKCSCPDHQKRQEPCKHMLALAIYIGAIKLDQS